MMVGHTMICDGCNLVIAPGARKDEDYDLCFGYHWHKKPSCIRMMCETIKKKQPELTLPPAA